MNNRTVSAAFRYALLALASLIIAAPLVWAVSASLRPVNESFASGNVFFGTGATLENFRIVLTLAPFARYYVNSLAQVSLIIVFQVVFSSLAAYAFARRKSTVATGRRFSSWSMFRTRRARSLPSFFRAFHGIGTIFCGRSSSPSQKMSVPYRRD